MKYGGNITVLDDQGATVFERELSQDEIIDALLAKQPIRASRAEKEKKPKAIGKAAKSKDKEDAVDDDDKTPRKKIDRAMIERLLKDSDLSAKEIAEKAGCSDAYVYLVKTRMTRDGLL
jgi:DNA invertase Pin-like site-specific DNA recombinase